MDWATVLSFTFVASLLVISPGPNGVLIAKTVPLSGKAAGFMNVFGFFTAFYVHGALSILGISLILVQSGQAFLVMKLLGAGYLCWVGFKALRDAARGIEVPHVEHGHKNKRTLMKAFLEGFLTNGLNPKVSIFYLAAFPQFIPATQDAAQSAFMLVVIHSVMNVMWFSGMVILFARLSKVARKGNFQRWLKGITGAVFVGFGVKLAMLRAT